MSKTHVKPYLFQITAAKVIIDCLGYAATVRAKAPPIARLLLTLSAATEYCPVRGKYFLEAVATLL